jgi:hypothetical protein
MPRGDISQKALLRKEDTQRRKITLSKVCICAVFMHSPILLQKKETIWVPVECSQCNRSLGIVQIDEGVFL